jgi:CRISPR/Cas system-associated protein Cas10 (large subunit of type III CRISPR-Cas system)
MTQTPPETPLPVYRGLDRCDLCGEALAPRERLGGLCPVCRDASSPTSKPHHISP